MLALAQALPLPEQPAGRTATSPAEVSLTVAVGQLTPLTTMFCAATGAEANAMSAASTAGIAAKRERNLHRFKNCLFIARFVEQKCIDRTGR